jgi:integrase
VAKIGRRQKLGPSLGIDTHPDGSRYWRVSLPVLDTMRQPVPGARRRVVRLPYAMFSRAEAEAEMRRLYREGLKEAASDPLPPRELLLENLLAYHRTQTCGPAPKRPKTQETEFLAIRDVACWLSDTARGREDTPSAPADILPPGMILRAWAPVVDVPLESFDAEALDRLKTYLARRLGATTVNIRLRALAVILRWLVERGKLARQPIQGRALLSERIRTTGATTAPAKSRKRHYTLGELALLDGALHGEARRFARLAYLTGARRGELAALTPACIDEPQGLLHVPAGKTTAHAVLLTPAIRAELSDWGGWTVRGDYIGRVLRQAVGRLGIDVAQPLHGLRHALTTALSGVGVSWEDISRWQGRAVRSGMGSVGAYDHAHMEALRRVAAQIPIPWGA